MARTVKLPVRAGEKKPALSSWVRYQSTPPTENEVQKWESEGFGFAAMTGDLSDGLAFLDFDRSGVYDEWKELIPPDLLARLCGVWTATPGRAHVWFRIEENDFTPWLALRKDIARDKSGVIIEFRRGNGLIGVIPCLNDHRYRYMSDVTVDDAPTLTKSEVWTLVRAAQGFGIVAPCADLRPSPGVEVPKEQEITKPGDEYAAQVEPGEVLQRHGWSLVRVSQAGARFWRRPGKAQGVSASEGGREDLLGRVWVFTTNAPPLEADRSYSSFQLLALLEYDGNFTRAAQDLAEQGFGQGEVPRILIDEVDAAVHEVRHLAEEGKGCSSTLLDKIKCLLPLMPELRATWKHARTDFEGDERKYDLSLIRHLSGAGFEIPEIVEALYERRRMRGEVRSWLRTDQIAQNIHFVTDIAAGSGESDMQAWAEKEEVGDGESALAAVNQLLQLTGDGAKDARIVRVVRVGFYNTQWRIVLANGRDVYIGGTENILSQDRFNKVALNALMLIPRLMPRAKWRKVVVALNRAAEVVVDEESEMEEVVMGWVQDYVRGTSVLDPEEVDEDRKREICSEAVRKGQPIYEAGYIYISGPVSFKVLRRTATFAKSFESQKAWGTALKTTGWRQIKKNAWKQCRRYWRKEMEWSP